MKTLFSAVSALILNGFISTLAFGHPPAYGPEGLIPHSHTGDGTVITGNVVLQSHNDCPETTLPAILGMQTEGPCIRIANGRPVDHHVSGSTGQEAVLISGKQPTYIMPLHQPAPIPVVPPVIRPVIGAVVQPVARPVIQRPVLQPLPTAKAIPVMMQPVSTAAPKVIMQAPAQAAAPAMPRGPELVTQFEHDGEMLGVFNTHVVGFLGMTLIKIADSRGTTRTSWWAARSECYTRMAFVAHACWSHHGYHSRFLNELERVRPNISGPGVKRSNDPCDHYTRLEAIIAGDNTGLCGY